MLRLILLVVRLVDEQQVDVRAVVQLPAAKLPHADHRKPAGQALEARRGTDLAAGQPERLARHHVGQVGDLPCRRLERLDVALALLRQGQAGAAQEELDTLVSQTPDVPEYLLALAEAQQANRQADAALTTYRKGLRLLPSDTVLSSITPAPCSRREMPRPRIGSCWGFRLARKSPAVGCGCSAQGGRATGDFGDDATLDIVAAQLDAAAADTGLGVVLFRAGAAPWHDDLGMLARLAARMASAAVRLFRSLDVWDICALLAHCRVHAGSSLHGHIVAAAFGVPAVGLLRRDESGQLGKLAAYAATWEAPADAAARPVTQLAEGIRCALRGDAKRRHEQSAQWVSTYRECFERLRRCL